MFVLPACAPLSPQVISPLENAGYVSPRTTLIVRYGPPLSTSVVAGVKFRIQGSKSGSHTGQTILADDHKTVIFKPNQPFTPGKQVTVNVNGFRLDLQTSYDPISAFSQQAISS